MGFEFLKISSSSIKNDARLTISWTKIFNMVENMCFTSNMTAYPDVLHLVLF